jgi:hypothetical protein
MAGTTDATMCGKGGQACASCNGHSCNAGVCETTCTPVVLATGQGTPKALAVDSTTVYWTNFGDGTVMSCPVAGCTKPTLLGSGQWQPNGIAVDSSNVYWVNYAGPEYTGVYSFAVWRPIAATTLSTYGITWQPMEYLSRITVNAGEVYFTAAGAGLFGCPTGGCAMTGLTPLVSSLGADHVVADSTYVYWSDQGRDVKRCNRANCAGSVVTLSSMQDFPLDLAIDSTNVYWTNTSQTTKGVSSVVKCAIGGCNSTPTVLATGLSEPLGIAVDSTNVYWTDAIDGAAYRCPLSGCPGMAAPLPFFAAGAGAKTTGIAIDATNAYFTDAVVGGNVVKCAK